MSVMLSYDANKTDEIFPIKPINKLDINIKAWTKFLRFPGMESELA